MEEFSVNHISQERVQWANTLMCFLFKNKETGK